MTPFQELSAKIKAKHHAAVSFPLSHQDLRKAIQVFIDFLALPQEIKDPIYFKVEPSNRGSEVGYKLYKRDLGNTDNREYFHYHALAEERFAEPISRIPELSRLMDAMRPVYQAASKTFSDILQQFLIEASLVCFIGGALGIALALAIGFVFEASGSQLSFIYSGEAFAAAIACSTLIGLTFGFLPARNAARLDPVAALARD